MQNENRATERRPVQNPWGLREQFVVQIEAAPAIAHRKRMPLRYRALSRNPNEKVSATRSPYSLARGSSPAWAETSSGSVSVSE